jgi:hypothetical protein
MFLEKTISVPVLCPLRAYNLPLARGIEIRVNNEIGLTGLIRKVTPILIVRDIFVDDVASFRYWKVVFDPYKC